MRYEIRVDGQMLCECRSLADVAAFQSADLVPEGAEVVAVPTSDDVRAECARRLLILFGARDEDDLSRKISNASREAIRLLRIKSSRAWTAAEATRAAELEGADALMEAMRDASNTLEPDPPADFTDDGYWPSFQ